MAIAQLADLTKELPYLIDEQRGDEEAAGTIAGVKELRPRDSGAVTVDMQPRTYFLYCNIAGHYAMGMWKIVAVTG